MIGYLDYSYFDVGYFFVDGIRYLISTAITPEELADFLFKNFKNVTFYIPKNNCNTKLADCLIAFGVNVKEINTRMIRKVSTSDVQIL